MGNYLDCHTLEQRMTAERLEALCQASGTGLTALTGAVIERAEALIDGFAAGRYQTPLPPGDLLEEWTLCIAEYELCKRGPGGSVPEKIRESYQDCINRLTDLAAGRIRIAGNNTVPARPDGQSLRVSGRESCFDAESMGGF